MNSIIYLIKMLKKLSKNNFDRIKLLLQYKAPLICKRTLLQIEHPVVRLCTLQLLKPLIKFLTPRWKQS